MVTAMQIFCCATARAWQQFVAMRKETVNPFLPMGLNSQSHAPRAQKKLQRRHHDTQRRHAGSHPQQPSFYFCCAEYIICISAPMLMWVACKCIAYWSRTVEKQVCGNLCVLDTAISCFATVISRCAFLPYFPILFRLLSIESSLYNARTLQDCWLHFPATTTHCRSQKSESWQKVAKFSSFQHWNHVSYQGR